MKKLIALGIITFLTMGLSGCNWFQSVEPAVEQLTVSEPVNETNTPDEGANMPQMSLSMKKWTWISAKDTDGKTLTPNMPDVFTLTFNQDGQVLIGTDCNNMSSEYTAKNNSLVFGLIRSTKMYCEGSQEGKFGSLLNTVNSYRFTSESELILSSETEPDLMTFR